MTAIRKPKYLDSESGSRWMVSYVDMMTILLVLFVAIAAQSVHSVQARSIPPTPPAAPKPLAPEPVLKLSPALAEAQRKLQQQHLNLRVEPRGLVISLPQTILFSSGQDQIDSPALPVVSQIADVLREIPNKVTLVGHADAVPIHNHRFKNNWDLSMARGMRLMELLSREYGIAESRLSISSYGSYSPIEPNDTQDGRASNRRVEIVILNELSL